jgi:hypothetical protein
MDLFRASWTLRPSLMPYSGGRPRGPSILPFSRARSTSARQNKGSHACRQRSRSPEPLPNLDLRLPPATKSVESPLSQSSKYHLNGNLRISRALSIGLICTRYRILALCQQAARQAHSARAVAKSQVRTGLRAGAKEIRTHGPTPNASVPRALHGSRHCSSLTHQFEKTLQGAPQGSAPFGPARAAPSGD